MQGMVPHLDMLRGEALQYGGGAGAAGLQQPRRIKHFPLARLPRDAPARFAALFAERQRCAGGRGRAEGGRRADAGAWPRKQRGLWLAPHTQPHDQQNTPALPQVGVEDLERYVQDLRGPGQTAEALLLKFTRASQARPTDPVTYSAR